MLLRRLGPSSSTFTPLCCQLRQKALDFRSRRTTGQNGYGPTPGKAWRYNASMDRVFTMQYGKRFGLDVGLEDRMFLLSLGTKQRRLDDKKMKRLSEIFQRRIYEIIQCHEALAGKDITFTKLKLDKSFSTISISWLCKGTGDEEISKLLEENRRELRRQLAESLGGGNVPEIVFNADRTDLMLQEMELLFKKADYGVDYRTLSNAARVMGKVPEDELTELGPKDRPWIRRLHAIPKKSKE